MESTLSAPQQRMHQHHLTVHSWPSSQAANGLRVIIQIVRSFRRTQWLRQQFHLWIKNRYKSSETRGSYNLRLYWKPTDQDFFLLPCLAVAFQEPCKGVQWLDIQPDNVCLSWSEATKSESAIKQPVFCCSSKCFLGGMWLSQFLSWSFTPVCPCKSTCSH